MDQTSIESTNEDSCKVTADQTNIESTNEDSCKVTAIPQVIMVKEYPDGESHQATCGKLSKRLSQLSLKVHRASPCPLLLEDAYSIRSDHDTSSVPDDSVIDIEQTSSMVERFSDVINRTNFQLFGAICFCAASFLSLTLGPYHNVILFPYYWYEYIFTYMFGVLPCTVGNVIVHVKMILEYQGVTRRTLIFKLFLTWTILFVLCHSLGHILWSVYLGYVSPMPFVLFFDFYLVFPTSWIVVWRLFPENMRCNAIFCNRLKADIWYMLWASTIPLQIAVMF